MQVFSSTTSISGVHVLLVFTYHHLCPITAGLCGKPRITDVGGVPYLVPLVQKHKVDLMKILHGDNDHQPVVMWFLQSRLSSFQEYNMNTISKELELPGAFVLGAAAAPSRVVGMNAEVYFLHQITNSG